MRRKIVFFKKHFSKFYEDQPSKVRDKIDYVLDMIRTMRFIPENFLKKIAGSEGLYEIRIQTFFKSIRIFCFFDKNDLVILLNCIIKKSDKLPKKDLDLAIKLKNEYYSLKY